MKVTLISLDQLIISYGLRIISSCLKKEGVTIRMIFARVVIGRSLEEEVETQIIKICKGSSLVGISLMSNHFLQATSLTNKIKERLKIPVIWGGVHPTFCPEECLRYADMVCIGEGEKSMVELLKKIRVRKDDTEIKGIWFKKEGKIIRNSNRKLTQNLDELPMPDYGPDDHFIRDGEKIKKMTKKLFEKYLTKRETPGGKYVGEYYISSSRGCPYRCAYCASNTIKNLYPNQNFFRLRSVDGVIEEAKYLTNKYPFIRWIYFADDDLLASPPGRVKDFCEKWKKEVKLPFYATLAPWSYDESKLQLFLKAGLGNINMGIQTVSLNGGRVYRRLILKNRLREIIKSIHKLSPPMPPLYDFILDNPYETDKDKLENLDFILEIPRPKKLQLFSLIPFPGTEIYQKMKSDELITDERKMIYQKCYSYPEANYINMLIFLAGIDLPIPVIRFLRSQVFLFIFNNKISKWVFKNLPYLGFLVLVRSVFNARFWRFNTLPKGDT